MNSEQRLERRELKASAHEGGGEGEDHSAAVGEPLKEKKAPEEDYAERWLRLQAEFENFKKRKEKELSEFRSYANEELVRELLPVLDSLEQALMINPGEGKAMQEGLELILGQLKETLKRTGLREIVSTGESFDPRQHEAVLLVETTAQPENTVLEEVQRGYLFKDKVLRPAKVSVAKAPPPGE